MTNPISPVVSYLYPGMPEVGGSGLERVKPTILSNSKSLYISTVVSYLYPGMLEVGGMWARMIEY